MPSKVKFVYVLDVNGNPLMPTKRFGISETYVEGWAC